MATNSTKHTTVSDCATEKKEHKNMLRIAIIGIGWAGKRHVEAIKELDAKMTVAALIDNDAEHLAAAATEWGISTNHVDYTDALSDPTIDAVSICTPHPLHCPMALAAAEAGKHILVEKPMALTVADATRMIEAANAHGIKLYVAENASYTPMTHFLRDVIQRGEPIGQLTSASVQAGFRAPNFGYPGRRAWLTTLDAGGTGTWMLHGIHTVAQMRTIFGEFATVYMQEHKTDSFERTDLEGTMNGLLTLESGVAVSILQTSESKLYGDLGGYTLHGEKGSIHASKHGYRLFNAETGDAGSEIQPYPPAALSDYALEMNAFADYVNNIAVGPTTGMSERRSLAIVQAGYESAASGRAIHLAERFGNLYDL
ncbi:Gfo/Idh/MocA family oxidoreductase [Chloroflexi bacterium TSY]|nr:Gfo/Idh/MocA family oxidoreductase [Chloroflexi bacterium TSY]